MSDQGFAMTLKKIIDKDIKNVLATCVFTEINLGRTL